MGPGNQSRVGHHREIKRKRVKLVEVPESKTEFFGEQGQGKINDKRQPHGLS